MRRDEFEAFSDRLLASVSDRPDVIGLVFMGSAADRSRADEWSDHDFALVVQPGLQDEFKRNLDWLPEHERIAVAAPEHEGGRKVIYDTGHVLEFGVASVDDLALWQGKTALVVLDRGEVGQAIDAMISRQSPRESVDAEQEILLFIAVLLIGVGRHRRGEKLIAGEGVRSVAVRSLLEALVLRKPGIGPERLDPFDVLRRIELVHPAFAARVADAQERDVETCARLLLELAEDELAPGWDAFPHRGAQAVRRRLGWG